VLPPNPSNPRKFIARLRQSGFSLVEVVLAVGVISFAFVAILGLLPAGLHQFRQAMDNSVAAQISQRIIQDAQQSDFDILTDVAHVDPSLQLPFTSMVYPVSGAPRSVRYFDEQGNEVVTQSSTPSQTEAADIVYTVNTRIVPWPTLPGTQQADVTTAANSYGRSMVTLTVQVVYNPACMPLTLGHNQGSSNYLLVDTTDAKMKQLSVRSFSAQIGRND